MIATNPTPTAKPAAMRTEYINPFVVSGHTVIEMVLAEDAKRGELQMLPYQFTTQQCNVTVGVTGQVQGMVIYGMSLVTADRIASKMIGAPIKTFDQLASSAIGELCNMISGSALRMLSDAGFVCDITPPTMIRGSGSRISMLSIPALVVPLVMAIGEVQLIIALQERAPRH